ncbi:MAG: hypothetical protein EA401_01925 [Planctomycetota bacterium]|nr:MAG: hypothetical protein EA401_01925 [Planctomycetota bacterium]
MRALLVCFLVVFCASASALDTPLTLTQPHEENQNRLVTIDESSGAMRLYEMTQGRGDQALRQVAPWNFLIDLDRIMNIRMVIDNPHRQDRNDPEYVFWPLARTGSFMGDRGPSNVPLYGQMYQYFLPQQRSTVLATEDAFFNESLSYDGNVQAALSRHYLFLVIPSTFTILVYNISQDSFELAAYRNYRPELYLTIPDQNPRGLPFFGSNPQFNDIIRALRQVGGGDLILQQRAQRMEEALESMESEQELIPVSASEPWVQGLRNNHFVVVDPANNKIMLYGLPQNNTLTLTSLRNFDLDRRLPSWPMPRRHLNEFDRAVVEAYLQRLGRSNQDGQIRAITQEVADWVQEARRANELQEVNPSPSEIQIAIFRQLAEQQNLLAGDGARRSQGSGRSSTFEAVVDPNARLVLDLKDERRLLVYQLFGSNNRMEMVSSRDYTIETGIAVYDYELSKQRAAARIFNQIESLVRRPGAQVEGMVLSNIQYLLAMSPSSYEQLEANRRIVRRFGEHEMWQPTIEKAMADSQAQRERVLSLVEMVKDEFRSQERTIQAAKERAAERGNRR